MRRTVIGLAAAAVFVLGACGGDDDSSGDDGGSDNEAGEVSASSPEAERFCNDFLDLTQQGSAAGTSPEAAVEAMRGLEPPEEIADAFALTIEGTELQAQMAAGGEGQPDPELQAQFQERSQEFEEANMQVQEFLATECQLGPPPSAGGESGESGDGESGESGG